MTPVRASRLEVINHFLPFNSHQFNYLKNSFRRDHRSVIIWTSFILFILFVYHFLSDGDFSFLLVFFLVFSLVIDTQFCYWNIWFLLVLYKVITSHSLEGLSLKSLLLYSFVVFPRLITVLFSDAYLPYDRSGDWIYRGTETLGAVAIISLLAAYRSFRFTYYSYIVVTTSFI